MQDPNPLANREYHPLPPEALGIYEHLSMPPRLLAHLIVVHDTACQLVSRISAAFPGVEFDADLVRFGAAVHDIGKSTHRNELIESGKEEHLEAGLRTLESLGISQERSRFAFTHARWDGAQTTLEDLLVALADKCWKGKRIDALESRTADILSAGTGKPVWECYAILDEIRQSLSQNADERLAWQKSFAV
jgi:putative nucleotidyltransferase with HDIG domain